MIIKTESLVCRARLWLIFLNKREKLLGRCKIDTFCQQQHSTLPISHVTPWIYNCAPIWILNFNRLAFSSSLLFIIVQSQQIISLWTSFFLPFDSGVQFRWQKHVIYDFFSFFHRCLRGKKLHPSIRFFQSSTKKRRKTLRRVFTGESLF